MRFVSNATAGPCTYDVLGVGVIPDEEFGYEFYLKDFGRPLIGVDAVGPYTFAIGADFPGETHLYFHINLVNLGPGVFVGPPIEAGMVLPSDFSTLYVVDPTTGFEAGELQINYDVSASDVYGGGGYVQPARDFYAAARCSQDYGIGALTVPSDDTGSVGLYHCYPNSAPPSGSASGDYFGEAGLAITGQMIPANTRDAAVFFQHELGGFVGVSGLTSFGMLLMNGKENVGGSVAAYDLPNYQIHDFAITEYPASGPFTVSAPNTPFDTLPLPSGGVTPWPRRCNWKVDLAVNFPDDEWTGYRRFGYRMERLLPGFNTTDHPDALGVVEGYVYLARGWTFDAAFTHVGGMAAGCTSYTATITAVDNCESVSVFPSMLSGDGADYEIAWSANTTGNPDPTDGDLTVGYEIGPMLIGESITYTVTKAGGGAISARIRMRAMDTVTFFAVDQIIQCLGRSGWATGNRWTRSRAWVAS